MPQHRKDTRHEQERMAKMGPAFCRIGRMRMVSVPCHSKTVPRGVSLPARGRAPADRLSGVLCRFWGICIFIGKGQVAFKGQTAFPGRLLFSGVDVILGSDARVSFAASGTPKGIFPGRVAWVYNTNAALWTGAGNYWDASVNPQAEYNKSFTAGIAALSGGTNDADSWDKIFRWFNNSHGRPGTGYQAGDMIAIKINQNNSPAPAADHGNAMNANPQTCVAVLTSLVNAGIPQPDIWIGDPSRAVTDNIFNAIHGAFPNVNVVDYFGNNGRVTTAVTNGVFPNSRRQECGSAVLLQCALHYQPAPA